MQLASLPTQVLSANRDVLAQLQYASAQTISAQTRLDGAASVPAGTKALLASALEAARQAAEGLEHLGAGNVLDGTFQRYTGHAVRDLQAAVDMLGRSGSLGRDARDILAKHVFDAEVATRLGAAAGERSLANPSPRTIERATEFAGGSSDAARGPVWVDGEWLDELGNPVRGGGSDVDGVGSGWDGMPSRGEGGDEYVGPDGEGYSGI